jgi:hypothetical protein
MKKILVILMVLLPVLAMAQESYRIDSVAIDFGQIAGYTGDTAKNYGASINDIFVGYGFTTARPYRAPLRFPTMVDSNTALGISSADSIIVGVPISTISPLGSIQPAESICVGADLMARSDWKPGPGVGGGSDTCGMKWYWANDIASGGCTGESARWAKAGADSVGVDRTSTRLKFLVDGSWVDSVWFDSSLAVWNPGDTVYIKIEGSDLAAFSANGLLLYPIAWVQVDNAVYIDFFSDNYATLPNQKPFVTVYYNPGAADEWSCSQSIAFADTADTTVNVSVDYTLANGAEIDTAHIQWSYDNFVSVAGDTAIPTPTDPDTIGLFVNEHDSVWVRTIAKDVDSSYSDTSETIVVQTFYTIAHSLSVYNLSYNSFGVIDNYTANTVTEMNLYISQIDDISEAFLAATKSSDFGAPDSLDEPQDTLTPGETYYYWIEVIDDEMGSDTSSSGSVTLYTVISLDSIIVVDTNSTSIYLLTWISDYNTQTDSLFTYVSADSDSVAGLEPLACLDTTVAITLDSARIYISGLVASTKYYYIQIAKDIVTGLEDTTAIASITTNAAVGGCECDVIEKALGDSLAAVRESLQVANDKLDISQDSINSLSTQNQALQDSANSLSAQNKQQQDSLNSLSGQMAELKDSADALSAAVNALSASGPASWSTADWSAYLDSLAAHITADTTAARKYWQYADRQLTTLDEDNTTIDLDNTPVGSAGADTASIKAMLGNNAWGWTYATRSLTDKAGFSLASDGLDGVTQGSGHVLIPDSSAGDISYTANNQGDYKATDFAVAGDAMTLTPGERGAIKDTMLLYASYFKADVSNLDLASTALRDALLAGLGDTTRTVAGDSATAATVDYSQMADSLRAVLLGPGPFVDSLYVLDTADSSAIVSCPVIVKTDGGNTKLAWTTTDANGMIIFSLDSTSYDYYVGPYTGYTFTGSPFDVTISGNQTDTLWGTSYSSGLITLEFYQLSATFEYLPANRVYCQLVKDSLGTPYKPSDKLSYNNGMGTILLSKKREPKNHDPSDSSKTTFEVASNYDIYVNGIQDSSSYYAFQAYWKDGEDTKVVVKIDKTSPQNPIAP